MESNAFQHNRANALDDLGEWGLTLPKSQLNGIGERTSKAKERLLRSPSIMILAAGELRRGERDGHLRARKVKKEAYTTFSLQNRDGWVWRAYEEHWRLKRNRSI